MSKFNVEWYDLGRKPQVTPNPNYPRGIDVDLARDATKSCRVELPYPAPQVGFYVVSCWECGLRVGLTTAGRADDPRSLKMACRPKENTDGNH